MKRILSLILCLVLAVSLLPLNAAAAGTPTVRVSSAQAKAGETVTVEVAVENNPGIFALTFRFQYDTSRLKLTAVTPNTQSFPGTWQAGSLKGATWASNAGDITANDTILTMRFEVLADAPEGDAAVEVVLGEIINEAMDDIEFSSVPGTVTVTGGEPAEVYGAALSLGGDIGLNFFLILPRELLADPAAYVTLEIARQDTPETRTLLLSQGETRTEGDYTLYRYPVSLRAKQMNDVVTLHVYDGEGNAVTLLRHSDREDMTGTGYPYSVAEYIRQTRENGAEEKLLALVNAMSDYGSLAQKQFAYGTESCAAIQGDLESVTAESVAAYAAKTTPGTAGGVSFRGGSLVLRSETAIRLYFSVKQGSAEDYSFLVNGEAQSPVETANGWLIEIPNIAAKDLDATYTVTVTSGEGTVVTVEYSALSYMSGILTAGGTGTLTDLVKGLVLYNRAADAYFG